MLKKKSGQKQEDSLQELGPSPITTVELQGKHLYDHIEYALHLDADRSPTRSPFSNTRGRSRSLPNVNRDGADGGVP